MDQLVQFLEVVLGFVPVVAGAGALIAFLVDQAKRFGLLPDGKAPLVSLILNAAVWVAFYFAGEDNAAAVQGGIDAIYIIAPYIATLIVALLGTEWAHGLLTGIGVGYSHPK